MSYELQVGDYVNFTRVVFSEKISKAIIDPGSPRAKLSPHIPEQIIEQAGSGQIVSIAKSKKKVKRTKFNRKGELVVHVDEVQTARIAAGVGLGTVTAVLDDATLAAKQGGLFDMAPVDTKAVGMYSQEADGGA